MKKNIISFILYFISVYGWAQQFKDVTDSAGIDHVFEVYEGMFGGGVAVLDFNRDGFEDLYLTGGMLDDQLLMNLGDGTFKNVLRLAEMKDVLNYVTQGVASADFNRDGWPDLFISTITTKGENKTIPRAQNLVFINTGLGAFYNASEEMGISTNESFSTGVSIGDFNLDGYPDVYVGNYFTNYDGGLKEISDATIVNAGKTARGYLYENRNGKQFKEVSKEYGITQKGFSFGGVFTDFDNDNDLDLIINNDFGYKAKHNYLLENQYPKKKFAYVEDKKNMNLRINAMGAATADINADGHLDYFISNIRFNRFMIYDSESESYIDQSKVRGTQLFTISWGANFADFDQDGDIDLFVANGDLNPNSVPMYNFYFENKNGTFTENGNAVGLRDYGIARGSVVFDLENDGDLDLLVVAQKPVMEYGPPSITRLYRNDLIKGNYLKVKLNSRASAGPFGTRIELYSDSLYINNEIDGGNTSHLSHNSSIAHFGLGDRLQIDSLLVTWPGGEIQKKIKFSANQTFEISELQKQKKSNNKSLILIIVLSAIISLLFYKKFLKF